MEFITESIKLNIIAPKIPFVMSNPSIKKSPTRIMIPFITSKKRPKVRMVTGIVSKTRIGLSRKFNIESTKTNLKALVISSSFTKGKKCDTKSTTITCRNNLSKKVTTSFL
jgi:hypothetical protein